VEAGDRDAVRWAQVLQSSILLDVWDMLDIWDN
jgi:hypothetical protein